jgi:chorismate--pyruvate lyase
VIREVYLRCHRIPVVFAHSVIAAADLRGVWRAVAGLGTRPLGAALFADRRVRRYPLQQRRLPPGHELHRRACLALDRDPGPLWARRSIFALGRSPILVTEVFLPAILDL